MSPANNTFSSLVKALCRTDALCDVKHFRKVVERMQMSALLVGVGTILALEKAHSYIITELCVGTLSEKRREQRK